MYEMHVYMALSYGTRLSYTNRLWTLSHLNAFHACVYLSPGDVPPYWVNRQSVLLANFHFDQYPMSPNPFVFCVNHCWSKLSVRRLSEVRANPWIVRLQ